jgi:tryptophan-rich hypothetical protein
MNSQFKNNRQVNISSKKLLLSKWTAIEVIAKQKHFLVSKLIQENDLTLPITEVEIEAVYSGQKQVIAWRELQDVSKWKQGWV